MRDRSPACDGHLHVHNWCASTTRGSLAVHPKAGISGGVEKILIKPADLRSVLRLGSRGRLLRHADAQASTTTMMLHRDSTPRLLLLTCALCTLVGCANESGAVRLRERRVQLAKGR